MKKIWIHAVAAVVLLFVFAFMQEARAGPTASIMTLQSLPADEVKNWCVEEEGGSLCDLSHFQNIESFAVSYTHPEPGKEVKLKIPPGYLGYITELRPNFQIVEHLYEGGHETTVKGNMSFISIMGYIVTRGGSSKPPKKPILVNNEENEFSLQDR